MKTTRLLSLVFVILGLASPFAHAAPSLAGHWEFVPERSTTLTFWTKMSLDISIDGNKVQVTRVLSLPGDNATNQEVFNLDTTKDDNVCPAQWYADNRYDKATMGLFIGGDGAKHIRASWLDSGRTLRLDANFVVNTQQGPKPANTLSDYKLSVDGATLTLIQIRSARMTPFVYVFRRKAG